MEKQGAGITVTQHILKQQRENPEATGAFTTLLNELIVAAKVISREVNKAGLVDILGATGKINVQEEQVQKLDVFANQIIIERMQHIGQLWCMVSEEDPDLIGIPSQYPKGDYILLFDPLDGSSNIDVNVSIGTIFGIFKKKDSDSSSDLLLGDVLQPGISQVAAGYFIYGSSTIMVYTTGNNTGVHGFTLFPSLGEFLLSHENIRIPEQGKIYSINEGNCPYWDERTLALVDYFKTRNKETGRPYTSRYVGSLVADFHRNLLKGGIFMYPADNKDPKKPTGKLRLMVEANPLAMVVKEAGGYASDGHGPILEIAPLELHQRVPLYIGSKKDVELAEAFISGKRS
ncbi:MAG: class 1 fructose-bisphosphatase [Deltaproteobacteria bacterium]|nr:class 1 fructose-bisphosphatase [Deltaproteobacteria bacterium]MBW1736234.1 class 1 fructose-bisphosphatase [Deltaproteobacteria bacterium]MBW1908523.1 class 1 fructose-bisphosphatase [Deltaproteobacteria bacterium]MBW2032374.1 class 1 fructose-bisphosphatase [Deltaproteobacteria bacterium]MBW2113589.1 class 1 fructose-bisphosphatase [Deltaproteobacteria bacterium]